MKIEVGLRYERIRGPNAGDIFVCTHKNFVWAQEVAYFEGEYRNHNVDIKMATKWFKPLKIVRKLNWK